MSRVLVGVILGLSTVLTGCSEKEKPAATGTTGIVPPQRTPDATYTIRGEIVSLPVDGDARTEFRVHHQPIPDFKNKEGKVVGMKAMTMAFPPAKGVNLSNLKAGDKVSITFSVWWGNTPGWLTTKVEKLPDDTKLEFESPKPEEKK